jgi:hypothetical protein
MERFSQFVGVKFTPTELCDLRRAARRSSLSAFIRTAVAKAIAEQSAGGGR